MEKFSPKKIINFSPFLLPLVLAACQAPIVDAYPILTQKCKDGNVTIVNGVPIAGTSFILANGEHVAVGKDGLGTRNLVTSKGNGNLTITTSNSRLSSSNPPPVILDDGRIKVKNTKLRWNTWDTPQKDILAISHFRLGDHTMIGVAMNCMNPALLPPIGKKTLGLSPSKKGSKPAIGSFKGFGHR